MDAPIRCPVCGGEAGSRWYCRQCGAPLFDPNTPRLVKRPSAWQRWGRNWTLGVLAALMTLCTVLIVLASLSFDPAALFLAVAASAIPAFFYSYLVLRLDRYEREPRKAVLAAFGWGAVAAVLLAIILQLITGGVLLAAVGEEAANTLLVVLGAPLTEESTKGIALLLMLRWFRHEFDNVLDGIVYGALIGLGFAMTENILYLGAEYVENGAGALGELFIARVVLDGFGHAAYTATTGAAVGWARSRYRVGAGRFVVPVFGWSLAVLFHALWNGSLVLFGDRLLGDEAEVVDVVLIMVPLFVLPIVIVLFLIARMSGKRELEIMREQLAPEVMGGVLTPDEYETLVDNSRRRSAIREAKARGGKELRHAQQSFFQVAAELAFRKHHISRGEAGAAGQRAPEDAYRAELAVIRARLANARL